MKRKGEVLLFGKRAIGDVGGMKHKRMHPIFEMGIAGAINREKIRYAKAQSRSSEANYGALSIFFRTTKQTGCASKCPVSTPSSPLKMPSGLVAIGPIAARPLAG
jgi:hypothetical protein